MRPVKDNYYPIANLRRFYLELFIINIKDLADYLKLNRNGK